MKQMYGCMGTSTSGHIMARCAPQSHTTDYDEHYGLKMEKAFEPFSDKQA